MTVGVVSGVNVLVFGDKRRSRDMHVSEHGGLQGLTHPEIQIMRYL